MQRPREKPTLRTSCASIVFCVCRFVLKAFRCLTGFFGPAWVRRDAASCVKDALWGPGEIRHAYLRPDILLAANDATVVGLLRLNALDDGDIAQHPGADLGDG